jgi:hypothetical protein
VDALRSLIDADLLEKHPRSGKPTVYRLATT